MKLLFWNTKKIGLFDTLHDMLFDQSPDIFFACEIDEGLITDNLVPLAMLGYEHYPNPGCKRISIIKKTSLKLSLGRQDTHYTCVKEKDTNITIVSVHLPSQMFSHIDGLKNNLRQLRNELDLEIGDPTVMDIVVIGDFNVSPYEKAMIDFDGFGASNSSRLKRQATHLKQIKTLYYNPTWSLYNRSVFPGTIYFKRPSASSFDVLEHHLLDQVVLSYSMSQRIAGESLRVLENTKKYIFFDHTRNKVKLSDHLPIIYEYKI